MSADEPEVKSGAVTPPVHQTPKSGARSFLAVRLYRSLRRHQKSSASLVTDHHKNERMLAGWTRGLAIFTLLLVLVGAVSDYLFYQAFSQQTKDTQDALKLSAKQAGSVRAWVGAVNIVLAAELQAGTGVDATVQYENLGREPAVDVTPSVSTAVSESPNIAQSMIVINSTCESTNTNVGTVAMPFLGIGSTQYTYKVTVDKTTIDSDAVSGSKQLLILGCFAYRTVGDPSIVHHSSFCYYYVSKQTSISNLNICSGVELLTD